MHSHHHVQSYWIDTLAFLAWFLPTTMTLALMFAGQRFERLRRARRLLARPVIVMRHGEPITRRIERAA